MALNQTLLRILKRYGAPCAVYRIGEEEPLLSTLGYLSVLGKQDRRYDGETLSPMGLSDSRRYLLISLPSELLPTFSGDHRIGMHGEWYHPLVSEPIRLADKTIYLRTILEPYIEGEVAAWTS